MVGLVGPRAARRGADRLLDCLQDQTYNKHLLYTLLDRLIQTAVPELAVTQARLGQTNSQTAGC